MNVRSIIMFARLWWAGSSRRTHILVTLSVGAILFQATLWLVRSPGGATSLGSGLDGTAGEPRRTPEAGHVGAFYNLQYQLNPGNYWPQIGNDHEVCSVEAIHATSSQAACQARAAAKGHYYYQFRFGLGEPLCATALLCKTPVRKWDYLWRRYRSPRAAMEVDSEDELEPVATWLMVHTLPTLQGATAGNFSGVTSIADAKQIVEARSDLVGFAYNPEESGFRFKKRNTGFVDTTPWREDEEALAWQWHYIHERAANENATWASVAGLPVNGGQDAVSPEAASMVSSIDEAKMLVQAHTSWVGFAYNTLQGFFFKRRNTGFNSSTPYITVAQVAKDWQWHFIKERADPPKVEVEDESDELHQILAPPSAGQSAAGQSTNVDSAQKERHGAPRASVCTWIVKGNLPMSQGEEAYLDLVHKPTSWEAARQVVENRADLVGFSGNEALHEYHFKKRDTGFDPGRALYADIPAYNGWHWQYCSERAVTVPTTTTTAAPPPQLQVQQEAEGKFSPLALLELVVVADKEPVTWLDTIIKQLPEIKVRLMCMDDSLQDPRCQYIGNVKRPERAQLNHIVERFETLSVYTIFATGGPGSLWGEGDDCAALRSLAHAIMQVDTTAKQEQFPGFAALKSGKFNNEWEAPTPPPLDWEALNKCADPDLPRSLGKFYRRFIHYDIRRAFCITRSRFSIFVASAKIIQRYRKRVWERLLHVVEKCPSAMGPFMEASWMPMLGECGVIPRRGGVFYRNWLHRLTPKNLGRCPS